MSQYLYGVPNMVEHGGQCVLGYWSDIETRPHQQHIQFILLNGGAICIVYTNTPPYAIIALPIGVIKYYFSQYNIENIQICQGFKEMEHLLVVY